MPLQLLKIRLTLPGQHKAIIMKKRIYGMRIVGKFDGECDWDKLPFHRATSIALHKVVTLRSSSQVGIGFRRGHVRICNAHRVRYGGWR